LATSDPEPAEGLGQLPPGTKARQQGGPDSVLNRVRTAGQVTAMEHPVAGVLRQLGLHGTGPATKFVPELYLLNSVDVRLGVLQGLLDSDGGPVVEEDRTCQIRYATVSPRLRDDVLFLVRSVGGIAYSRVQPAAGRRAGRAQGRDVQHHHHAYVLDIRLPAGIQPFRLATKLQRYHACGGGGHPQRFIESIEPEGKAQAVCIAVAAADSLYATDDFLLTHNTLNDSFIILDEAQNTSPEQMKMFLTRLGFGSRIVVTGDITQVDLPAGTASGLRQVQDILEGVDDVYFSRLTSHDVVRHKLVADIVDAYERYDARQIAADPGRLQAGRQRRDGNRAR
jgi:phosphate starvation-inducible protein PhoH and related proteins